MQEKNHLETIDQGWLDYLSQFITEHKKSVMEKVLAQRTRFMTVVLEDIFKTHNASAVLRTCDCFGIQDVHVIEKVNAYKINPFVTRGASQWIDLYKYHNKEGTAVKDCFSSLREKGYKIYGTSPLPGSISIHDLEPDEKIALVFGNEHEGISAEVQQSVDGLVHIPMLGFTESFNISVAASISLYELVKKVENYDHPDFYLTEHEKQILRMKWFRSVVTRADLHEKAYLKSKNT
ncbi:TrmH family RNA methyltransferase [Algoriphagus antarcticus]|uniref:tRNA (guanosine(18)-2'-O)-methyltransferase n=1 Tax=Algoriphagus antarcticus TaxID=238540 RepID=A0A3E0E7N4_9BACT|nr:RNA methyltransferase [Algoriphagus antarcticus]REG94241.1 tRNA (guanosine-2'-O-)-methyltransferase [Algoriphagus antarcticus]